MKRSVNLATCGIGVLVVAFLVISTLNVAQAQSLGAWKTKIVYGKVVDINKNAREITLVDSINNEFHFSVDANIKNFDKISVGEKIKAKCYISYAPEIRKPTQEEMKAPYTELDRTYDPPANTAPISGKLKMFRDVVKVTGTDPELQMVSVVDSRDKNFIVSAPLPELYDPAHSSALRAGDTIVITYVQPIIISITPE